MLAYYGNDVNDATVPLIGL